MSLFSMCRAQVNQLRQTLAGKVAGVPNKASTVLGTFSCDIQPASSRVRDQWMQKKMAVTHTIFFPTDVQALDTDLFETLDTPPRKFLLVEGGYQRNPPGYSQWPGVAQVVEQVGATGQTS